MNFTSVEYAKHEISHDVSNMISVTLEENDALYRYLLVYIAKNLTSKGDNLYVDVLSSKASPSEVENRRLFGRIALKLGSGEYSFRTFDGKVLHALHHMVGKPVGTDCGAKVMKRLNIFSDGTWEELGSFLNEVVEKMATTEEDKFICYTWKIRYNYWDEEAKVNKRPIDSVVLPSALKLRLINDMTKFLDPKTKAFYLRNGIPYRRSYLFYGTPGTGKTSMVQALAGHFGRNVCFLMPTHPDMTDDSLRSAVNSIPENSIVVFEDIDALFDKSRSNQVKKSSLTFSGLLNALDGIGSANGQVFVLTTNLRENLDHALIRNGRVDLHFEFSFAVPEQMELMWRNFYPDGAHLAQKFASAVSTLLNENQLQVTTSALQHFFVAQMDSTPEEALSHVSSIVDDIRANSSQSMLKEATKQSKGGKNKGTKPETKESSMKEETESSMKEETETSIMRATSSIDSVMVEKPIVSAVAKDDKEKLKKKNKKNKKPLQQEPVQNGEEEKKQDEKDNNKDSSSQNALALSVPVIADPPGDSGDGKKKKKKKNKKNKKPLQQEPVQNGEEEKKQDEKDNNGGSSSENVSSSEPVIADPPQENVDSKTKIETKKNKGASNVVAVVIENNDKTEVKDGAVVEVEKIKSNETEKDSEEKKINAETTLIVPPIGENVEDSAQAIVPNDMAPLGKRQHKNRVIKRREE